jgi:hypothetical protein
VRDPTWNTHKVYLKWISQTNQDYLSMTLPQPLDVAESFLYIEDKGTGWSIVLLARVGLFISNMFPMVYLRISCPAQSTLLEWFPVIWR